MELANEALVKELREKLLHWFERKNYKSISVEEKIASAPNSQDDYFVVSTIIFRPNNLDMMQMEVWITDDGCLGIGIENRQRVLARYGVERDSRGFITGHEPIAMSVDGILYVLEMAAAGKFCIIKRGSFFLRLYELTLYTEECEYMDLIKYDPYIYEQKTYRGSINRKHVLKYQPWS